MALPSQPAWFGVALLGFDNLWFGREEMLTCIGGT